MIADKRLDLPEPDGPITVKTSPGATVALRAISGVP